MCAGNTFRGTFHDCRFESCEVYVVHGASVSLTSCSWHACSVALTVHGPTTASSAGGCTFQDSKVCTLAQAGASLAVNSCHLGAANVGAVSNDPGSHVSAKDSQIELHASGAANVPAAHQRNGLRAWRGCATLRRCTISGADAATVTNGPDSSMLLEGVCVHTLGTGSMVRGGAWATLAGVRMHVTAPRTTQSQPGTERERLKISAAALVLKHSCAQLIRCSLESRTDDDSTPIHSSDASRACLRQCTLSGGFAANVSGVSSVAVGWCEFTGSRTGVRVQGDGTRMRMHDCEVIAQQCACSALDGARVLMRATKLNGAIGGGPGGLVHGAMLQSTSCITCDGRVTCHLLNCRVRSRRVGVRSLISTLEMKDTVVECIEPNRPLVVLGKRPSQGLFLMGGSANISASTVLDFTHGADVSSYKYARDESLPGFFRMHAVTFDRYAVGVHGTSDCELTLESCTFSGHAGVSLERLRSASTDVPGLGVVSAAAVVTNVRHASLTRCMFAGNRRDIVCCDGGGELQVEGCEFTGVNSERETAVAVLGRAALTDCRFSTAKLAVEVTGERAHCTLRACVVGHVAKQTAAGVLVTQQAEVKVLDSTFKCRGDALAVSLGGKLAVQDCACEGVYSGLVVHGGGGNLTGKRVTVRASQHALVARNYVSAPEQGGWKIARFLPNGVPERCEVKLVDCDLTAARSEDREHTNSAVCVSDVNTEATLSKCSVQGGKAGVQVLRGAVLHLRKSSVSDCAYAIEIGEDNYEAESACDMCGLSGDAALARAWQVASGAVPAQTGALCVHQGTVASAYLREVQVSGCLLTPVGVYPAGVLHATRVHVTSEMPGFEVKWAGKMTSTFEGCTVNVASRMLVGTGVHLVRQLQAPNSQFELIPGVHFETVLGRVGGVEVRARHLQ